MKSTPRKKSVREKQIVLSQQQYQEIVHHLEKIQKRIEKKPPDEMIDNATFLKMMKVSLRTAQNWRNNGVVGYVQIGGKIFYRPQDISELIDKHHKKPHES